MESWLVHAGSNPAVRSFFSLALWRDATRLATLNLDDLDNL